MAPTLPWSVNSPESKPLVSDTLNKMADLWQAERLGSGREFAVPAGKKGRYKRLTGPGPTLPLLQREPGKGKVVSSFSRSAGEERH